MNDLRRLAAYRRELGAEPFTDLLARAAATRTGQQQSSPCSTSWKQAVAAHEAIR